MTISVAFDRFCSKSFALRHFPVVLCPLIPPLSVAGCVVSAVRSAQAGQNISTGKGSYSERTRAIKPNLERYVNLAKK